MARSKVSKVTEERDLTWQDKSRAGIKVRIRGERGEFTVVYEAAAGTPHGEHVCLFGGPHQQYRTPAPDRVVWPRKRRGGAT